MPSCISDLRSADSTFSLWLCHTSSFAIAQIFYNMPAWDLWPAVPAANDALLQVRVWIIFPFSVHYLNDTFSVGAAWTDLFKIVTPTEATNLTFPTLLSVFLCISLITTYHNIYSIHLFIHLLPLKYQFHREGVCLPLFTGIRSVLRLVSGT